MILPKLEQVDTRTVTLVWGFVRRISKYLYIPTEIRDMCLGYYHIPEYFTKYGSGIDYDEEINTITNTNGPTSIVSFTKSLR